MRIEQAHTLSRRRFAATAAMLATRRLFAEDEGIVPTMLKAAAGARITINPLRRNISVIEGSGGNIAVLTGGDGKLLIDAGFSASWPGISDAPRSMTADPIRRLINSHRHFDHTDGNAWLHSAGARIIAHENTRKHLATQHGSKAGTTRFPPRPPAPFLLSYSKTTISSI